LQLIEPGRWDKAGEFNKNTIVSVKKLQDDTEYFMRGFIKERGGKFSANAQNVPFKTESCTIEKSMKLEIGELN